MSYRLSYSGKVSWKIPIYLASGNYQTLEDLVNGMMTGMHSSVVDIYVRGGKKVKHIGGRDCFYINPKARHYYELNLPTGYQVTLPKNLAKALGYLNHDNRVPSLYHVRDPSSVQLNEDQSVILKASTSTMRRNDELVWGMLSLHSFQSM